MDVSLALLDLAVLEHCEQGDCQAKTEAYCPLCCGFFCAKHDVLPGGHRCMADVDG